MDLLPLGMFSKRVKTGEVLRKICSGWRRGLFFGISLWGMLWGQTDLADRIAAIVNGEIITLTDVKIVSTFNIIQTGNNKGDSFPLKKGLDSLINQKLVIQLTVENINLSGEELERKLQQIKQEMGSQQFESKLEYFGLKEQDLTEYLNERITFQKIIQRRFSRKAAVSLKEIETYYQDVYVPSMEERKAVPKPLVEMLDEIESILQREKAEGQINDWLENLRQRSDVVIKIE